LQYYTFISYFTRCLIKLFQINSLCSIELRIYVPKIINKNEYFHLIYYYIQIKGKEDFTIIYKKFNQSGRNVLKIPQKIMVSFPEDVKFSLFVRNLKNCKYFWTYSTMRLVYNLAINQTLFHSPFLSQELRNETNLLKIYSSFLKG